MSNGEMLVTVHWRHNIAGPAAAAADAVDDDDDDDANALFKHPHVSLMNGRICHTTQRY